MNRKITHGIFAATLVLIFVPGFVILAGELGETKGDAPEAWATAAKDEPRTHADEEERYIRLYREYLEAINNAESDEERLQLRRKFDQQTGAYQAFLAEEHEASRMKDMEKRVKAIQDDYQKKRMSLQQAHDREMRRIKAACREPVSAVNKNWLGLEAIESTKCQQARALEETFRRDLLNVEKEYDAKLKTLQ